MGIGAACGQATHLDPGAARPFVVGIVCLAPLVTVVVAPTAIATVAQQNLVKLGHGVAKVEERKIELASAVFFLERDTKRVFWRIFGPAAGLAMHAGAAQCTKARGAIRVDPFDRDGALPFVSQRIRTRTRVAIFLVRVVIDTGIGVPQIGQIGHQRNGWDRKQHSVNLVGVVGMVDNVRIHLIVSRIGAIRICVGGKKARPARRRCI